MMRIPTVLHHRINARLQIANRLVLVRNLKPTRLKILRSKLVLLDNLLQRNKLLLKTADQILARRNLCLPQLGAHRFFNHSILGHLRRLGKLIPQILNLLVTQRKLRLEKLRRLSRLRGASAHILVPNIHRVRPNGLNTHHHRRRTATLHTVARHRQGHRGSHQRRVRGRPCSIAALVVRAHPSVSRYSSSNRTAACTRARLSAQRRARVRRPAHRTRTSNITANTARIRHIARKQIVTRTLKLRHHAVNRRNLVIARILDRSLARHRFNLELRQLHVKESNPRLELRDLALNRVPLALKLTKTIVASRISSTVDPALRDRAPRLGTSIHSFGHIRRQRTRCSRGRRRRTNHNRIRLHPDLAHLGEHHSAALNRVARVLNFHLNTAHLALQIPQLLFLLNKPVVAALNLRVALRKRHKPRLQHLLALRKTRPHCSKLLFSVAQLLLAAPQIKRRKRIHRHHRIPCRCCTNISTTRASSRRHNLSAATNTNANAAGTSRRSRRRKRRRVPAQRLFKHAHAVAQPRVFAIALLQPLLGVARADPQRIQLRIQLAHVLVRLVRHKCIKRPAHLKQLVLLVRKPPLHRLQMVLRLRNLHAQRRNHIIAHIDLRVQMLNMVAQMRIVIVLFDHIRARIRGRPARKILVPLALKHRNLLPKLRNHRVQRLKLTRDRLRIGKHKRMLTRIIGRLRIALLLRLRNRAAVLVNMHKRLGIARLLRKHTQPCLAHRHLVAQTHKLRLRHLLRCGSTRIFKTLQHLQQLRELLALAPMLCTQRLRPAAMLHLHRHPLLKTRRKQIAAVLEHRGLKKRILDQKLALKHSNLGTVQLRLLARRCRKDALIVRNREGHIHIPNTTRAARSPSPNTAAARLHTRHRGRNSTSSCTSS
eukprot:comp22394_c0_seq2/m.54448 comp22394_c0_seq2/g.54448  ORF comp22394_c0_seq2/g.54448 comp22394_c0_seq2/m.54448 type:complete len:882 (-) comp22394_c0_seq2:192-2837(-)